MFNKSPHESLWYFYFVVEVIPLCCVLITGFIYNIVKHNMVFLVVF